MWRQISISTFLTSLMLLTTAHAAELLPGGQGRVLGQYIVVLKGGGPSEVARTHRVVPSHVYQHAIRGFAAALPDAALRRLLKDPNVDYIEPDGRVWANRPGKNKPPKDDPGVTDPPLPSQSTPWGVTRVGGPQDGTGLTATAWVIDTGIDYDHADLNVDTSRAANFVSRGRNTADDGNDHGTHVAGTIAAIDNDIDVVGVAAGATVVPVRVLDNSGSGFYSWVIAGIDYVAQNGSFGDVANMSLSGGASDTVNKAVRNAAATGIHFVLAAGNDSVSATTRSPASANGSYIYTVSAIDASDNFAWFSNYGNPPVDVAAPGVNIESTARGGGTTVFNGTSMAAPHVAGLLLLGSLNTDGAAQNDPDGTPDPIAHYHY